MNVVNKQIIFIYFVIYGLFIRRTAVHYVIAAT